VVGWIDGEAAGVQYALSVPKSFTDRAASFDMLSVRL
jgi:hypothetical protein